MRKKIICLGLALLLLLSVTFPDVRTLAEEGSSLAAEPLSSLSVSSATGSALLGPMLNARSAMDITNYVVRSKPNVHLITGHGNLDVIRDGETVFYLLDNQTEIPKSPDGHYRLGSEILSLHGNVLKDSHGVVRARPLRLGSGQRIQLTYTWNIPAANFANVQPDDYFFFNVPGGNGIFETSSFNFNNPVPIVYGSDTIGHYTVDTNGVLKAVLNNKIIGKLSITNGIFQMQYGIKLGKGGFLTPDNSPGHEHDEAVSEEEASESDPKTEGKDELVLSPSDLSVKKRGTVVQVPDPTDPEPNPALKRKIPRLQWRVRINDYNEKKRLETGSALNSREFSFIEDHLQEPEMEVDTSLGFLFTFRIRLMTKENKVSQYVLSYPSYQEYAFVSPNPGESYSHFRDRITQGLVSKPKIGVYPATGTEGAKVVVYFGTLNENTPFTYDKISPTPNYIRNEIMTLLNNLKAAGDIDQDQYDNTIAAYKLNQTTLAPVLDYTFHFYTKQTTNKIYHNEVDFWFGVGKSGHEAAAANLEYKSASGSAELNEKTDVKVTKCWLGKTGSGIHVKLTGSNGITQEIDLPHNGNWEYTFENLPKNRKIDDPDNPGHKKIIPVEYSVEETNVPAGYEVSYTGIPATGPGAVVITNKNIEKVKLTLHKHWQLGSTLPANREITVNIYDSRDTAFAHPIRENIPFIDDLTINDLPKYDSTGLFPPEVPVQYVVIEKTAAGEDAAKYMPKYQYDYSNPDEQKATITNYGTKEFFVRKFWENTGQTVPVWVVLKANGVPIPGGRKQLTAPDWRVSFGRHKLYDDHNQKINYTIEEEVPTGYQPVPKIEETLEGFSVTNTPLPPTTPYEPPTPETPPEPTKPPVTPPTPPIPEVPFDDNLPRDVPEVELPKTDGVPAMVFFGAGLGLAGVGIFLKKRKK